MLKFHGGFKVGDKIEYHYGRTEWIKGFKILDFSLLKVQIEGNGVTFWTTMQQIRHPHLVRRKHG